jgi:hypothetical protein
LCLPTMLKTSQILAPTKYQRTPKIHWFSPNYSSLYICSQTPSKCSKCGENKKW